MIGYARIPLQSVSRRRSAWLVAERLVSELTSVLVFDILAPFLLRLIMWFKNLDLFRFTRPFALDNDAVEASLGARRFRPCGAIEAASSGWVSPVGGDDRALTHIAGPYVLFCLKQQEKLLPASVVNDEARERIAEVEAREARKLGRRERAELKDAVIHELLPRAFVRSRRTFAYIDRQRDWLVVDSASNTRTDELTSLARKTFGELTVVPLRTEQSPPLVMSHWLMDGSNPPDIRIEQECELRAEGEEGGIIRCRNQDLAAQEIQNHLLSGKQVNRLAFCWNDRLTCVLDERLGVRRLRFLVSADENAGDRVRSDDEIERFDADFSLMTLELAEFLGRLPEFFGGVQRPTL